MTILIFVALGASMEGFGNMFVCEPELMQEVVYTGETREGIEDFLTMMHPSKNPADVEFFVRTAELMVVYHEEVSPVVRVLNLFGLPAIHAENKVLVVPLAVDYGSWTSEADRLSKALMGYKPEVEISKRLLYVSGRVSPLARKELEARGFTVSDGAHIPLYK